MVLILMRVSQKMWHYVGFDEGGVKNTTFVPEAEKSPLPLCIPWLLATYSCAYFGYLLLCILTEDNGHLARERGASSAPSQFAHNVEASLKRDLLSLEGRSDTAHETTPSAVLTNVPK